MKYSVFPVLILFTVPTMAQLQVIGRVTDGDSEPVPFASVLLSGESEDSIHCISDSEGRFTLTLVKEGSYRLMIEAMGQKGFHQDILIPSSLDLGILQMEDAIIQLDEILIRQERSYMETKMGKRVFHVGEDLASTGGTLSDVLSRLPSVEVDEEGRISVRGGQNVLIFINGRETARNTSSLGFISAENIEKVEIVTTPPANYDAEGVSGIINIIYKKKKEHGINLDAALTTGYPPRYSGNLNASYKPKRVNYYSQVSFNHSENLQRTSSLRTGPVNEITESYSNLNVTNFEWNSLEINSGVEFSFNKTTQMTLDATYWRWGGHSHGNRHSQILSVDLEEDINIRDKTQDIENEFLMSWSFNREFTEGHKLNIFSSFGGEDEDNFWNYNVDDVDLQATSLRGSVSFTDQIERQRLWEGRADYVVSLNKTLKLQTGIKSNNVRYSTSQRLVFYDPSMTGPINDFKATQWKNAVYLMTVYEDDDLTIGLGARMEHFESTAKQQSLDSMFTNNYLNIFPSAQFSYQIGNDLLNQQFGFSYSKRIDRPGFFDLNPFISYRDPFNLRTGNPFLQPEFANSFEITYGIGKENWEINTALFNRTTSNVIQRVFVKIDEELTLSTPHNSGKIRNAGFEVSPQGDLSPWLSLGGSFSWYNTWFSDQDISTTSRLSTVDLRLRQTFSLSDQWKLEFTEHYTSPRIQLQSRREVWHSVDLGITRFFEEKRGNISVTIADIFNTKVFATSVFGENFRIKNRIKFQSRQIRFTLKYKILR